MGDSSAGAEAKRQNAAPSDYRSGPFELKGLAEVKGDAVGGWTFEGYFSVFNNVDDDRDVIRPGAFAASLARGLPKVKDHHGVTVGQVTSAFEDERGLYAKGRIFPTTAGRDLALLMQPVETDAGPRAPVEEGSIGYAPTKTGQKRLPDGTRELTEITLYEVSPVTFGANRATRISLVKSLSVGEYDGPVTDLLSEVSRVLLSAVTEAKGLAMRRAASGRDLGADHLDAIAELAFVSGDTMLTLLALDEKAGRAGAVSQRRRAYLAQVMRALAAYVDSLPDAERAELSAMIDDEADTAGDGGNAAKDNAGAGDGDAGDKDGGTDEAKDGGDGAGALPDDSGDAGDAGADAPDHRAELESELLRRRLAAHAR